MMLRHPCAIVACGAVVVATVVPAASAGHPDRTLRTRDYCSIVNNTLFHNDTFATGSGELQVQYFPDNGTVSNNIFENNILSATDQGVLISDPFTSPIVKVDYNLYYAPNRVRKKGFLRTWTDIAVLHPAQNMAAFLNFSPYGERRERGSRLRNSFFPAAC